MVPRESRQTLKESDRRLIRAATSQITTNRDGHNENEYNPNIAEAGDGQLDTCDADNGINRATAAYSRIPVRRVMSNVVIERRVAVPRQTKPIDLSSSIPSDAQRRRGRVSAPMQG
jgi:hypothetical protein